jgi:uncharacterized protein with HEPN domain
MLSSVVDAVTIVGSLSAQEVQSDMIRRRALTHCFMELGEAAAKLSPSLKAAMPTIPWRQIIGMRNLLIHVYWNVEIPILHRTTLYDLPTLIGGLQGLLNQIDSAG